MHTCDGEMSTSTTAVNAAKPWSGGSNGALIRPVDIVPAYLFGPQHKSIAYGLKLDGTVKAQRSVYNDGVVFNEIRRCAMGMPVMLGASSRGLDFQHIMREFMVSALACTLPSDRTVLLLCCCCRRLYALVSCRMP